MAEPSKNSFLFHDEQVQDSNHREFENTEPWQVLVVDDDDQIHQITRLVLNTYRYEEKALTLFHAYGKDEALSILRENPNICVILLDVVMSTDNEGLECVKAIREELKNSEVRIILRTGQAGNYPEHEVMLNYDINDYKSKTELTKERLFTSITAAIRTYQHLVKLETMQQELIKFNEQLEHKIAKRTSQLAAQNAKLQQTLSDLNATKQQLIEQQQQLIQSEKLASIGQLAAGVAHEINTPLGYVSSNFETLSEYFYEFREAWSSVAKLSPDVATQIADKHDLVFIMDDIDSLNASIDSGLKRIKSISGDLGHFSKMEKVAVNHVDINEDVVQLAINMVCSEIKPDIQIKFLPGKLTKITAMPIELSQVLVNLLMNANDAINKMGVIEVSTEQNHESVIIMVKDNGCGMSDNTLHKLFDPFFTTKDVGDGTGLGLSVSHKIVESHGGVLSVVSELGAGSEFTIKLPTQLKSLN